METIVLILHVLFALAMIGLILIQQGKGAHAGASFGAGASQTVFGSEGSGSFLVKATSLLAFAFFVTSLTLAVIAKQKAQVAGKIIIEEEAVPAVQTTPAGEAQDSDIPVIEKAIENAAAAEDAIPSVDATPDKSAAAIPEIPAK